MIRRFGKFECTRVIGQGGAGVVYEARAEHLTRPVAIKALRYHEEASSDDRERFRREAEAFAKLRHENIVGLYDYVTDPNGDFLVLELIDGRSLQQQTSVVDVGQAVRWMVKIARAVEHAHRHRILHRDLKPGNILLNELDEPMLTDFGMARDLSAVGLTASGSTLGTPPYMSPEQVSSKRELDFRTDVYGLGAVLYFLLTGSPPFVESEREKIFNLVLTCEPVPPRRLRSGVPRDLETICLKCLRKQPADRYASAEELAVDLERFQAGQPIRARRQPLPRQLLAAAKRRPGIAASIALASFLLFGSVLGAIALDQQRRAERELRERAEAAEADAIDARTYSEAQQLSASLQAASFALESRNMLRFSESLRRPISKRFSSMDDRYLTSLVTNAPPADRFLADFWGPFDIVPSPDKSRLLIADQGAVVSVWNLIENRLEKNLNQGVDFPAYRRVAGYHEFLNGQFDGERPRFILSVDWVDDRQVVMATEDGRLIQVDLVAMTETPLLQSERPIAWVRRGADCLLVVDDSGSMTRWSLQGEPLSGEQELGSIPTSLERNPLTNHWILGTESGSVIELDQELVIRRRLNLDDPIRALAISGVEPDGFLYVTAQFGPILELPLSPDLEWDQPIRTFDAPPRRANISFEAITVDLENELLIAADSQGTLNHWRLGKGDFLSRRRHFAINMPIDRYMKALNDANVELPPASRRSQTHLMTLPEGRTLLVDRSGAAQVWDDFELTTPPLAQPLTTRVAGRAAVVADASSPKLFWLLDTDGDLVCVDAESDEVVSRVEGAHPGDSPHLVALSAGRIASVAGDEWIKIWDVRRGGAVELRRIRSDRRLLSLAIHEASDRLATVSVDSVLEVRKLSSGALVHEQVIGEQRPHTGVVGWSRAGRYLAACGGGQQLVVMDVEDGYRSVDLSGFKPVLSGEGGAALQWSPTRESLMMLADSYSTASAIVRDTLSPSMLQRASREQWRQQATIAYQPTHDQRRVVGLTRYGELIFLSCDHFVETSKFDLRLRDSHAFAVGQDDRLVLVSTDSGKLIRCDFRPFATPSPRSPASRYERLPMCCSIRNRNCLSIRRVMWLRIRKDEDPWSWDGTAKTLESETVGACDGSTKRGRYGRLIFEMTSSRAASGCTTPR
ncbi:MAG: WD40 repeat domain-containing serine/threonine protein kinase [Pirellulaceae bacterium]